MLPASEIVLGISNWDIDMPQYVKALDQVVELIITRDSADRYELIPLASEIVLSLSDRDIDMPQYVDALDRLMGSLDRAVELRVIDSIDRVLGLIITKTYEHIVTQITQQTPVTEETEYGGETSRDSGKEKLSFPSPQSSFNTIEDALRRAYDEKIITDPRDRRRLRDKFKQLDRERAEALEEDAGWSRIRPGEDESFAHDSQYYEDRQRLNRQMDYEEGLGLLLVKARPTKKEEGQKNYPHHSSARQIERFRKYANSLRRSILNGESVDSIVHRITSSPILINSQTRSGRYLTRVVNPLPFLTNSQTRRFGKYLNRVILNEVERRVGKEIVKDGSYGLIHTLTYLSKLAYGLQEHVPSISNGLSGLDISPALAAVQSYPMLVALQNYLSSYIDSMTSDRKYKGKDAYVNRQQHKQTPPLEVKGTVTSTVHRPVLTEIVQPVAYHPIFGLTHNPARK
jgi:hypothetical protein